MIDELKKVGLSEYEARAYMALLGLGPSGGIEISKKSDVPKTRVYDVLKDLVGKGLVELIQKKPMVFKAVKPEIGVKHLFESKIEKIKDAESRIIEAMKVVKEKPAAVPRIHEWITTVLGYKNMYTMVGEWMIKTKKELSIFSVGEEIPYLLEVAIKRAIAKGVNCRLIVTKYDEENKHILKRHAGLGLKLRHYPSTGEWTFSVFDKEKAMINVRNPKIKEERISTFFEVPDLAKALAEYYETIWKKSKPVKL
jgi:sugar-specific transcriptional regulator TrmB